MRGLLLAALAAVSLVACGGKAAPGPRTFLVEKEGRFAVAVDDGKRVTFFPLPADGQALQDGQWVPLASASSGSGAIGVIPRCVCGLPDCDRYCRPLAAWWNPPPVGGVDPRTQAPPLPSTGSSAP